MLRPYFRNNKKVLSEAAQIIKHTAYTQKYNEKYEQAEWVAYKLISAKFNFGGNKLYLEPNVSSFCIFFCLMK
jgi:hypothetical protein